MEADATEAAKARTRIAKLSDGQRECLWLVGQLHTSKSIALRLGISSHSVDDRIRRALTTLDVQSRSDAAKLLMRYEAKSGPDPSQRLMHQWPQVDVARISGDADPSPRHASFFGDGVRNELAEAQAPYFASTSDSDRHNRWLIQQVFTAEHDLTPSGRIAALLGVAVAAVLIAASLVSIAEGLSRLV